MGPRSKATFYIFSIIVILAAIILIIVKPGRSFEFTNPSQNLADHGPFSELLAEHVDGEGNVDYPGFLEDESILDLYLTHLENNSPDELLWTESDQLAYWINAYNAFTIKLILNHYPVESIKDIGSLIQLPFLNSPWDIAFIEIGGESLTLNNIEHGILRRQFDEPRIHFAIVCASNSCPKLRSEAYTGDNLEEQLLQQAIEFVNDPTKNHISPDEIQLSKIFLWFGGDFTKNMTLVEFLNKYSETQIFSEPKKSYLKYDWGLNNQQNNADTQGGGTEN